MDYIISWLFFSPRFLNYDSMALSNVFRLLQWRQYTTNTYCKASKKALADKPNHICERCLCICSLSLSSLFLKKTKNPTNKKNKPKQQQKNPTPQNKKPHPTAYMHWNNKTQERFTEPICFSEGSIPGSASQVNSYRCQRDFYFYFF